MKRILITLFAIGMTAMSSVSMAAMSNSQVRKETRFLTDKMAYELRLNNAQYNDVYEINYDFIYNIRYLMDDVARGYNWAMEDYYAFLDVRNDDLRWVLSDMQYRSLLGMDYFFRPVYMNGSRWSFRVYLNYPNVNMFFFDKPYHYRTYSGAHYRSYYNNISFYRGRYNHNHYGNIYSVRDNRVFSGYFRSDFGSVTFRANSSSRPGNVSSKTRPVPPSFNVARGSDHNDNRGTVNRNNNKGDNGNGRSTVTPSRSSTETRRESTTSTATAPSRATTNTRSTTTTTRSTSTSGNDNSTSRRESTATPAKKESKSSSDSRSSSSSRTTVTRSSGSSSKEKSSSSSNTRSSGSSSNSSSGSRSSRR